MQNFFCFVGADEDQLDDVARTIPLPCHGQIFNRHDPAVMNRLEAADSLIRTDDDVAAYLEDLPPGMVVVPFHHARSPRWIRAWSYLREHGLPVIVACDPLRTILKYRPAVSYVDPRELRRVDASHRHIVAELADYFRDTTHIVFDGDYDQLGKFTNTVATAPVDHFDPTSRIDNWGEIKEIYEPSRSLSGQRGVVLPQDVPQQR